MSLLNTLSHALALAPIPWHARSMKYSHLLIDLDGTLSDTHLGIKPATMDAMKACAPSSTEADREGWFVSFYKISNYYWAVCDKGRVFDTAMQKEMLQAFFDDIGQDWDTDLMMDKLTEGLITYTFIYPEVLDVLETIQKRAPEIQMHLITNGFLTGLDVRLEKLKLKSFLRGIFVAEGVGAAKPSPHFFNFVLDSIGATPEACLIVGDQISSDIMGGIENGIDSCWVYRDQEPSQDPGASYVIQNLRGLLPILFDYILFD